MNYFIGALKKYAVFSGRATRSEYWYFVLFSIIFSIAIGFVDMFLGLNIDIGMGQKIGVLGLVFNLAVFVPGLAVCVRRLHDTNKSGWFILIGLIPILGWIALIVFLVMDSIAGDNKYGPNPKGAVATNTSSDSFLPQDPQAPSSV